MGENLLGMDVLQKHRSMFKFQDDMLASEQHPISGAQLPLEMDSGGRPYVRVLWPRILARACWDAGASITVVNSAFVKDHPELFESAGHSRGTDSTGTRVETESLIMAGRKIGGSTFPAHRVAQVDISKLGSGTCNRIDIILGYTTLKHADWIMDFPARRWGIARAQSVRPDR